MPETTLDQKKFTLTLKIALPVLAAALIVSNTFTLQIERVSKNAADNIRIEQEAAEDLLQVEMAGRRRLENSEEKAKLENRIIFLEYQLELKNK
tara:strand:- start:23507 stop:23788 length:282 start_codon:yes stop_codon:yes gene_type:complete